MNWNRKPGDIPFSYGDFKHTALLSGRYLRNVNRQTAFYGLVEIRQQFLKRLSLGRATGNRRNFSPISAFFGFMYDDFQFHRIIIQRNLTLRRKNRKACPI